MGVFLGIPPANITITAYGLQPADLDIAYNNAPVTVYDISWDSAAVPQQTFAVATATAYHFPGEFITPPTSPRPEPWSSYSDEE